MGKRNSGSRPLSLMSALLAFALSAAMGVAFVMVVNKTHDLFSSAAFADGVPNVAASLGWQEQTVIGTSQIPKPKSEISQIPEFKSGILNLRTPSQ
jgi:hypothetical protein